MDPLPYSSVVNQKSLFHSSTEYFVLHVSLVYSILHVDFFFNLYCQIHTGVGTVKLPGGGGVDTLELHI